MIPGKPALQYYRLSHRPYEFPPARCRPVTPPHKAREVVFTYHTELTGIDPKAHKVEAWIPLPREDGFQQ